MVKIDKPVILSKDYGISPWVTTQDGLKIITEDIQQAIDHVHNSGGGRLIFPPGEYQTGTLFLKSGVNLHFEEGAVLFGSTNRDDYKRADRWYSLIIATDAEDIALTGKGTIDGKGLDVAINIREDYYAGKYSDDGFEFNPRRDRAQEKERPQIIEFTRCKRVEVSGLVIKNSANWVQTYLLCKSLYISNLWIDSDAYWNNDGIDIENCRNVLVEDCDINTSDDGICLKSIPDGINKTIHIRNCRIRSSASGVKLGTDSFGGFEDIVIENITVYDTFRSAIALECVDGGHLKNIEVRDITARNTGNAIFVRLGNREKKRSPGICSEISIKNIHAHISFDRPDINYNLRGPGNWFFHNPIPSSITGIPGYPVESIRLENIELFYPGRSNKGMAYIPTDRLDDVPEKEDEYPEYNMFQELPSWGLYCRHVKDLSMKNIVLRLENEDYRPAIVFDDINGLSLNEINTPRFKSGEAIVYKDVLFNKGGDFD